MNATLPPPPATDAPLSAEEEAARDRDAAEAAISIAWQDALDWAKRGDRRSLAAMLRGERSLNDRDVRTFLADLLENKEKRPRGKPARRPEHTFFVDAKGRVSWIDKRDELSLKIREWVKQNRTKFPDLATAYEAAEKEFKYDLKKRNKRTSREAGGRVANIVRRSSKAWKKRRSI